MLQALFGRISRQQVAAFAIFVAVAGAMVLISYVLGNVAALIIALAGIALVLVAFALWKFPPRQVNRAGDITPKERVALENELRKTIAEAVGGLIVIVGLAATWLQLDATRDEQQLAREEQQTAAAQVATGQAITREQMQAGATQAAADRGLAQQGQITDRFTAAVEQLGSEDRAVRLGGIYALERIAHDSVDDVEAVMQVLTAFVRDQVPRPRDPGAATPASATPEVVTPATDVLGQVHPHQDVQAVLTVIERGWWAEQMVNREGAVTLSTGCLDLRETDLRGARFRGTPLVPVCLAAADLTRADLRGAEVKGADLTLAELTEADLRGAHLADADLRGADLEAARLDPDPEDEDPRSADLTGAKLSCLPQAFGEFTCTDLEAAHLDGTDLRGQDLSCRQQSDGVEKCTDLEGAHLRGADLMKTNLAGADLAGADLTGADLTQTLGLTPRQIASALTDATTRYPSSLLATPAAPQE